MISYIRVPHNEINEATIKCEAIELAKTISSLNFIMHSGICPDPADEKTPAAAQSPAHLQNIANELYHYGVLGKNLEVSRHPDSFNDLAYILLLAPVTEALGFCFPRSLITILFAAVARNKLNSAICNEYRNTELLSDFYMDADRDHFNFNELSALADMSLDSIRNATGKKANDRLVTFYDEDEKCLKVDMKNGVEWLTRRAGFKNTVIRSTGDSVIVPVSADGSRFTPDCKRNRGYQIGRKGEEVYIESFDDALEALLNMPKAYWRRPNEKGNFGIVSAIRWEPLKKPQV